MSLISVKIVVNDKTVLPYTIIKTPNAASVIDILKGVVSGELLGSHTPDSAPGLRAIRPNFAASQISASNDFVRHFDAKPTN